MSEQSERRKPVILSRLLLLLFWSLLAFYLVAGTVVSFNQRWFIYVPPIYTSRHMDGLAQAANLERWTNSAGESIGMKRLSARQPAEGSVLLLYGNGSCAVNCAHYADDIQSAAAFDVFILEYPGYGDRPGTPSQRSLTHAADNGLEMLPANKPIYQVGESLGSGVATHLAGTYPNKIAGAILLSPFDSLTDVAQYHMPVFPVHLILMDRFPSENDLRRYHGPVGVMVDGADRVVPEKFGLRLYQGYDGPKKLWEFPDGGHCQIMKPQTEFWKEVIEFWKTNQTPAK
jgi:pimeloyl-ACP methyl ester carboxylesterase